MYDNRINDKFTKDFLDITDFSDIFFRFFADLVM